MYQHINNLWRYYFVGHQKQFPMHVNFHYIFITKESDKIVNPKLDANQNILVCIYCEEFFY